jgi:hypothetical protein
VVSHSDDGEVLVLHEPNTASGGKPFRIGIATFYDGEHGHQHTELLRLIGTLIDESADGSTPCDAAPGWHLERTTLLLMQKPVAAEYGVSPERRLVGLNRC